MHGGNCALKTFLGLFPFIPLLLKLHLGLLRLLRLQRNHSTQMLNLIPELVHRSLVLKNGGHAIALTVGLSTETRLTLEGQLWGNNLKQALDPVVVAHGSMHPQPALGGDEGWQHKLSQRCQVGVQRPTNSDIGAVQHSSEDVSALINDSTYVVPGHVVRISHVSLVSRADPIAKILEGQVDRKGWLCFLKDHKIEHWVFWKAIVRGNQSSCVIDVPRAFNDTSKESEQGAVQTVVPCVVHSNKDPWSVGFAGTLPRGVNNSSQVVFFVF